MADVSAMRQLPEPDPILGGELMPDALLEEVLADCLDRNGLAYRAIAEAEATWS